MFEVYCSNKECRQQMQPILDKETDEVLCTECGKTIDSVTPFAKRQMVMLGQTKKSEAKQQAFAVDCPKCGKKAQPKIAKIDDVDVLVCAFCTKPLELSAPFANSIRQFLNVQR